MSAARSFAAYFEKRILAVGLLGIASGLPLALVTSTLAVWMREEGISLKQIGLFALVSTPYVIKFTWAPLIDHLAIPKLSKWMGQRRSWLLLSQIGLIGSIIAMGVTDPTTDPWMMAFCALCVASFSATQDIVIDAYRIELLDDDQQGVGAAMVVYGWRVGALISSAGALFLAGASGWEITYAAMAGIVLVGMVAALWIGEPKRQSEAKDDSITGWLKHAILEPFREFMGREKWLLILLFIVLYKLGDAYAGVMTAPFVIDMGFSKQEYATIVKLYGFIAGLIGAFIGGLVIHRMGMIASLWISGIVMMLSNLMFVAQAYAGYDPLLLTVTISVENLSGWMGNVVIVGFISQLCNKQFTATQYALFSALAATGRTWLSASSGYVAETVGWAEFFLASTVIALPGIALIYWISKIPPK